MGENDKANRSLDRRGSGGNYHGMERRVCMDQGKFIVATVYRSVFYGLLAFNIVLSVAVLNLTFFAKVGPRYTADDGAREKAERIAADKELTARIDALHPPVWSHE